MAKKTISPAPDTKRIRIVKGVSGSPWFLSYSIGDEIEINTLQAEEMIAAGVASEIES